MENKVLLTILKGIQLGVTYMITSLGEKPESMPSPERLRNLTRTNYKWTAKDRELFDKAVKEGMTVKEVLTHLPSEVSEAALRMTLERYGYGVYEGVLCVK